MADTPSPPIATKTVTMPLRRPANTIGRYVINYDSDQPIDQETTTILYGESGIGKTTIAKQWPFPFYVFFRGGGEHRPMPLTGSGIPFVEIYDVAQLDQLVMSLSKDGLPKRKSGELCQTIVIDQLPSLYNMYQTYILTTVARGRENEHTFGRNDFRQGRHHIHQLFFDLNLLKCHRLYLSISRVTEDEDTKKQDCRPLLPGVLAEEVPQFTDFTLHMHSINRSTPVDPTDSKKGTKLVPMRAVATQSYSKGAVSIFAKDSSGKLPPLIEIPTPEYKLWDEILRHLRQK